MNKTKNIYHLPLRKEDVKKVISDPRAHFGIVKHAIDFPLPEGTPILAALDGEVIFVDQSHNEGGDHEKYRDKSNVVTIKHGNGEVTEYIHLRHKGATVKVGDKVKTGQIIGYSGNTGWSTEPHLHFHVATDDDSVKEGWKTLEVQFNEPIKIERDFS